MPLYEFRCPHGHDFEKFYRSIGAALSEEKCPECGELGARLMSTAGLVFKGSGFYITDYGKDGKKDQRDAKAKADAPAATDTKPVDSTTKAADAAASGAPATPAKTEPKPAAAPPAKAPAKKAE